jgi:beta-hydroxylase
MMILMSYWGYKCEIPSFESSQAYVPIAVRILLRELILPMRRCQILALVVVLIIVAAAACAEAVRRQGCIRPAPRDFYRSSSALLAPYSLWCARRSAGGAPPFPPMEVHFPRHTVLRDAWREIRAEALAIHAQGHAKKIKGDLFFTTIADDNWKRFYIKWYGPAGADARALCPRTCALLDALPEVHLAMFSILEPGAVIRPHTGPFKACLRYHLGLSCPPEARILVDGAPYTWRDGEDVLFDDTYIHEVANGSATQPRVVLFCDVERAMTGRVAARINHAICRAFGPLTTRANDKTEKASRMR